MPRTKALAIFDGGIQLPAGAGAGEVLTSDANGNGTWQPAASGTIYDTDQVGTVKAYAGSVIPTNWMLADGRALSRTGYSDLFAAIGTTYGVGDGSTTFNIPDLLSRAIVGAGAGTGLTARTAGQEGGEEKHILSIAELAAHGHTVGSLVASAHGHAFDAGSARVPANTIGFTRVNVTHGSGAFNNNFVAYSGAGTDTTPTVSENATPTISGSVANNGSGTAHENMPPFTVIAYIIKVTGVQVNSGGALQGATGPPGADGADGQLAEFAIKIGSGGAGTSVPATTWTKLPMGTLGETSADYATCFRYNADQTVTILQSGWYSFWARIDASGAPTTGIQWGLWSDPTDVAPANPTPTWRREEPISGSSQPWSQSVVTYIAAGTRIGISIYNRGATLTFAVNGWGFARAGAGPIGPPGPSGGIPLVAALPGSPADGDMVLYQSAAMATAGIVWHLRYRAAIADAYKWEFLGGGPLQHEVNVSQGPGTAGAWVNLATDGPLVTCPLAGIYNCVWGANIFLNVRNILGMVGLAIGDTTPAWPYIRHQTPDTGAAYTAGSVTANGVTRMRMTVAAGNVLKLRYQGTVATTQNSFDARWLDVTPMRVG